MSNTCGVRAKTVNYSNYTSVLLASYKVSSGLMTAYKKCLSTESDAVTRFDQSRKLVNGKLVRNGICYVYMKNVHVKKDPEGLYLYMNYLFND